MPVSLIAHSGGGMTASQVAELAPDLVTGIVYVDGFMLPDGGSFAELVAAYSSR
jgi:pimeloyl-ACP methyl ester carboxylesterase